MEELSPHAKPPDASFFVSAIALIRYRCSSETIYRVDLPDSSALLQKLESLLSRLRKSNQTKGAWEVLFVHTGKDRTELGLGKTIMSPLHVARYQFLLEKRLIFAGRFSCTSKQTFAFIKNINIFALAVF